MAYRPTNDVKENIIHRNTIFDSQGMVSCCTCGYCIEKTEDPKLILTNFKSADPLINQQSIGSTIIEFSDYMIPNGSFDYTLSPYLIPDYKEISDPDYSPSDKNNNNDFKFSNALVYYPFLKCEGVISPSTSGEYTSKYATAFSYLENGSIEKIVALNLGNGYSSAPLVTIQPPPFGGVQATANAVISDGKVVSYVLTNPGSGYSYEPYVVVAPPSEDPEPSTPNSPNPDKIFGYYNSNFAKPELTNPIVGLYSSLNNFNISYLSYHYYVSEENTIFRGFSEVIGHDQLFGSYITNRTPVIDYNDTYKTGFLYNNTDAVGAYFDASVCAETGVSVQLNPVLISCSNKKTDYYPGGGKPGPGPQPFPFGGFTYSGKAISTISYILKSTFDNNLPKNDLNFEFSSFLNYSTSFIVKNDYTENFSRAALLQFYGYRFFQFENFSNIISNNFYWFDESGKKLDYTNWISPGVLTPNKPPPCNSSQMEFIAQNNGLFSSYNTNNILTQKPSPPPLDIGDYQPYLDYINSHDFSMIGFKSNASCSNNIVKMIDPVFFKSFDQYDFSYHHQNYTLGKKDFLITDKFVVPNFQSWSDCIDLTSSIDAKVVPLKEMGSLDLIYKKGYVLDKFKFSRDGSFEGSISIIANNKYYAVGLNPYWSLTKSILTSNYDNCTYNWNKWTLNNSTSSLIQENEFIAFPETTTYLEYEDQIQTNFYTNGSFYQYSPGLPFIYYKDVCKNYAQISNKLSLPVSYVAQKTDRTKVESSTDASGKTTVNIKNILWVGKTLLTENYLSSDNTGFNGRIESVSVVNEGSGYGQTFVFNGVGSITVVNQGSGYSQLNPPSVLISSPQIGGFNNNALAEPVILDGKVVSIIIKKGGDGYLTNPTVLISNSNNAPGSGATAIAEIGGEYQWQTNVTISPPQFGGIPAKAEAVVSNGKVVAINMIDKGSGYISNPSISISGSGTGATAKANIYDQRNLVGIQKVPMSYDAVLKGGFESDAIITFQSKPICSIFNIADRLKRVTKLKLNFENYKKIPQSNFVINDYVQDLINETANISKDSIFNFFSTQPKWWEPRILTTYYKAFDNVSFGIPNENANEPFYITKKTKFDSYGYATANSYIDWDIEKNMQEVDPENSFYLSQIKRAYPDFGVQDKFKSGIVVNGDSSVWKTGNEITIGYFSITKYYSIFIEEIKDEKQNAGQSLIKIAASLQDAESGTYIVNAGLRKPFKGAFLVAKFLTSYKDVSRINAPRYNNFNPNVLNTDNKNAIDRNIEYDVSGSFSYPITQQINISFNPWVGTVFSPSIKNMVASPYPLINFGLLSNYESSPNSIQPSPTFLDNQFDFYERMEVISISPLKVKYVNMKFVYNDINKKKYNLAYIFPNFEDSINANGFCSWGFQCDIVMEEVVDEFIQEALPVEFNQILENVEYIQTSNLMNARKPLQMINPEKCEHIGKVIDRKDCNCPKKWIRECELHEKTDWKKCMTCKDFKLSE